MDAINYRNVPDTELIQEARKGNKGAFKELFLRHQKKVMNYLCRYIGDYHTAKEVTMDTFLYVYKHLPGYREEGKFLAWVYRIATSRARDEFRRMNRRKELSLHEPISETGGTTYGDIMAGEKDRPDHGAMTNEFHKAVEEVLAGLDKKYRSVILLCDMEGMSYEEAARALKCSKANVGTRLSRARKIFIEKLRNRGFEL